MTPGIFLLLTGISCAFGQSRHTDHVIPQDDIIELPVGRFPDPVCKYQVKQRDERGPPISGQVKVGDAVYHEWTCSYGQKESGLYCLLVHNCTVSSSDGSNTVPILDEFGCSLFPTVLPHVEYNEEDLRGGLLVNAFSLDVEQAAVLFECNVKLLLKLNGVCRRPTCPSLEKLAGGIRAKRYSIHK